VAIPALVVYNYLVTRVDNLVVEMEISSAEVVDLLARHQDDDGD
jgi:biopolymer transport protein ExbB/TolQ